MNMFQRLPASTMQLRWRTRANQECLNSYLYDGRWHLTKHRLSHYLGRVQFRSALCSRDGDGLLLHHWEQRGLDIKVRYPFPKLPPAATDCSCSNIYPTTEAPRFIKGHAINLAFAGLTFVMTSLIMFVHWRDNRARDAISYAHPDGRDVDPANLDSEEEKIRWGYQGMSRDELLRLGDKHRGFRYVL